MIICPKCDQVLKDDAEFCINCGEIFNRKLLLKMNDFNKCPKCGAKLPEESEFCIRCGEIFDLKLVDDKILKKEEVISIYMGNTRIMKIKSFLFNYVYYFYKKMYFAGFLSFFLITFIIMGINVLSYNDIVDNVYYAIFYYTILAFTVFSVAGLVILSIKSKHILHNNAVDYALFTLSKNSDKNYNDLKELIIDEIKKKNRKGLIIGIVALLFDIVLAILII